MFKRINNPLPVLFLAMMFCSLQIHAAPGSSGKHEKKGRHTERTVVTLDDAVNRVKKRTNGRILTAETVTKKGRKMHRIKVLLPNGNVKVIFINAE